MSSNKYKSFSVLCFPSVIPQISAQTYYVLISLLGCAAMRKGSVAENGKSLRNPHGAWRMPSSPQWGVVVVVVGGVGGKWLHEEGLLDLETSASQEGAVWDV